MMFIVELRYLRDLVRVRDLNRVAEYPILRSIGSVIQEVLAKLIMGYSPRIVHVCLDDSLDFP